MEADLTLAVFGNGLLSKCVLNSCVSDVLLRMSKVVRWERELLDFSLKLILLSFGFLLVDAFVALVTTYAFQRCGATSMINLLSSSSRLNVLSTFSFVESLFWLTGRMI